MNGTTYEKVDDCGRCPEAAKIPYISLFFWQPCWIAYLKPLPDLGVKTIVDLRYDPVSWEKRRSKLRE